jgi:hypothetical protein
MGQRWLLVHRLSGRQVHNPVMLYPGHAQACKGGSWSSPTSDAAAARRAGGRARYNATRRLQATLRRRELIERWEDLARSGRSLYDHGERARAAREFGVHPATITRDMKALQNEWAIHCCPTCDSPLVARRWRELHAEGRVA